MRQEIPDVSSLGPADRSTRGHGLGAPHDDRDHGLARQPPASWWLFLFVIVFFPLFGGVLYLLFWLATSRTTIFLHESGNEIVAAGDTWMVREQEARREAVIATRRKIQEQGFFSAMWPHLLSFLVLLAFWVVAIRLLLKLMA